MIPLSKTAGRVYHLEWIEPRQALIHPCWQLVDHPVKQILDSPNPHNIEFPNRLPIKLIYILNNLLKIGEENMSSWHIEDFEEDDQIQVNPPPDIESSPFRIGFDGDRAVLLKG